MAHRLRCEALRGEPVDGIIHPPTTSPQAAQQAPAGAAERLVQRMEDWTDARYIAELENVVRLLRRELEKLHRVREVLSDCSAGQPCSTCPNKKACQRGCIRQEEFVSTEYHARQVAALQHPARQHHSCSAWAWIERWYGSGGKEGYEGWSIVSKEDRSLVAYLGRDVKPGAVTKIVMAHNAASAGTPVPHEQLTKEIENVLLDSDSTLSSGAVRALQWCLTWVSVPLQR